MAAVLHKTTKEYRASVNTPDFSSNDWLIMGRGAPGIADIAALVAAGVPNRHWKISGDRVIQMSQAEKDAVEATLLAQFRAAVAADAVAAVAAVKGVAPLDPAATPDERLRALELKVFGA